MSEKLPVKQFAGKAFLRTCNCRSSGWRVSGPAWLTFKPLLSQLSRWRLLVRAVGQLQHRLNSFQLFLSSCSVLPSAGGSYSNLQSLLANDEGNLSDGGPLSWTQTRAGGSQKRSFESEEDRRGGRYGWSRLPCSCHEQFERGCHDDSCCCHNAQRSSPADYLERILPYL